MENVISEKMKKSEITELSLQTVTMNTLCIAISDISYVSSDSNDSVPAQVMKLKNLMPVDAESKWLIDWMEKSIYEPLRKEYVKAVKFSLLERVEERVEGPVIEEYVFSFNYSSYNNQNILMNVSHMVKKRQGSTLKYIPSQEITPNQIRSSARKIVHTLIQLMGTLNKKPEEQYLLMKLLYCDDVVHMNDGPPFFGGCTTWMNNLLKMEDGNVNSREFVLAFKVKSAPDPSEDENDDIQNDVVSLAVGDTDSETENEGENVVAPIHHTQDPNQDKEQLGQVKEWIGSYCLDMPSKLMLSNVSNPRASRESFAQVIKNSKTVGNDDKSDELDTVSCGELLSQNKCSTKTIIDHVVGLDPHFLSITRNLSTIRSLATKASNYLDSVGILKWILRRKEATPPEATPPETTPPLSQKEETTPEASKVSPCSWRLSKDSPFYKLRTTFHPALTPDPIRPKTTANFQGPNNILKKLGVPRLGFEVSICAIGEIRAQTASDENFHFIALYLANNNVLDDIRGAMQGVSRNYGQSFHNIVRNTGARGWFVMVHDNLVHLVNNGNGRAVIGSKNNQGISAEELHFAGYQSLHINPSNKILVLGNREVLHTFTDKTLVKFVYAADSNEDIAEKMVNSAVEEMEENHGAINLGAAVIFFFPV